MKKLFITGTGTDVGKTFVTAGIASLALDAGKRVAVIKPVQTGLAEYAPDIREIRALSPGIIDMPEGSASAYSFGLPASPHLAAAEEKSRVSMARLMEFVDRVGNDFAPDVLLLEGAGGVLVPLNEKETFLDFMKMLDIPVLVVALAGLGTINHTLLTLEALKRKELETSGVVFNRYPENPTLVERDNPQVIERFSGVDVLALIKEFKRTPQGTPTPSELFDEFASHPRLQRIFEEP